MDPNQISDLTNAFFNNNIMGKLLVYAGWTLLGILIIAIFAVIYYLVQYKYKAVYPVLYHDADGQTLQIVKYKKDRARTVKKKDGTRKSHFLFKNRWTEPIDEKHISPGNVVNLLRINDDGTYITMPSLKQVEGIIRFEYLTSEEKKWAVLEMKETTQSNEIQDQAKRMLTYTIIAIVLSGAIAIVSIWLTLKYTGSVTTALRDATPVLGKIAEGMSGVGPG